MRTPFTAPAQSYAGDEPDTPSKRARQEWDRRMGAAVISARAWRLMAMTDDLCVSLATLWRARRGNLPGFPSRSSSATWCFGERPISASLRPR